MKSWKEEFDHVMMVLQENGYPEGCLKSWSKEASSKTFCVVEESEAQGNVSIPYVRGLSEGIRWILRPLGIQVLDRPQPWKWNVMANAKDKRDELEKPGVVYSMTCNDCDQVYGGETARNAKVRAKNTQLWREMVTRSFQL